MIQRSQPQLVCFDFPKELLSQHNSIFTFFDQTGKNYLSISEFSSLIYSHFRVLSNFAPLIFDAFSYEKEMKFPNYLHFQNSLMKFKENETCAESLPMILFSYLCEPNKDHLNIKSILKMGKVLFNSNPNCKRIFNEEDAKNLLLSQNPKNPKLGLSNIEFINFFKNFVKSCQQSMQKQSQPIGTHPPNTQLPQTNNNNNGNSNNSNSNNSNSNNSNSNNSNSNNDNSNNGNSNNGNSNNGNSNNGNSNIGNSNSGNINSGNSNNSNNRNSITVNNNNNMNSQIPKLSQTHQTQQLKIIVEPIKKKYNEKIIIDYKFDQINLIPKDDLEKYQRQFQKADVDECDALDNAMLKRLLMIIRLLSSKFVDIILLLFGKNGFINVDGYCEFRYSFSLPFDNKRCFARRIFDRFDTNGSELLNVAELRELGSALKLVESRNTASYWREIVNECRILNGTKGVSYRWFYENMFLL